MNEWKTESTWQSLARTLVAGTVVGGGTLLLFGNDPREAFANGFSFAAMFAAFAWLAGQSRWTWPKATIAAAAAVLGRVLGLVLADSTFDLGTLAEGLGSGAGAAVVLILFAWRLHKRSGSTAAG